MPRQGLNREAVVQAAAAFLFVPFVRKLRREASLRR